jgi:uncharacterized protein (DUF342 family)
MPTIRKKNELMFPAPKKSKLQDALKEINTLKNATPSAKKAMREAAREEMQEKEVSLISLPVRMKLTEEEVKGIKLYATLAQAEGKVSKNEKVALGEVVAFAVKKLLKADKYFQGKRK